MSTYVIVNGARITLRINAMAAHALADDYRASHPDARVLVVDCDRWDTPSGRRSILPSMSTLPVVSSR